MKWLALILFCALVAADGADHLLVRARHAQLVLGDLHAAIALYHEALGDKSLPAPLQAEAHLRLAVCYVESGEPKKANGHLGKGLYDKPGVRASVRLKASELRDQLRAAEPKPRKDEPKRDVAAEQARRLRDAKARARRYLRDNDVALASYQVQRALEIAPEDVEARALAAELETRLSGVMEFLQSPLQVVRSWTEARIRTVAREAETALKQALVHAGKGELNLAERYFREAIVKIDACEFGAEADELVELREVIRERWRNARRKLVGEANADPVLPAKPPRASLLYTYLNHLQRILDSVSSEERAYRIIPARARPTVKRTRARVVPKRFTLFDHLPSRWTLARFAVSYLPLRIHPDSWRVRGNYLEAAGRLLITRNRTMVIDDLQKAVGRIEHPRLDSIETRFLLVSVPRTALDNFAKQFGAFSVSERGSSPLQYRVIGRQFSLAYVCSYLRDEGANVKIERDMFEVSLQNGVAQTLFAGVPLPGRVAHGPADTTHYGLHLDLFPFRERGGRTALGLTVTARQPAPRLNLPTARFLTQQGELFADLAPGSILVVGGIVDPFAAGTGADRELLLLWEAPAGNDTSGPEKPPAAGAEISLRKLLLEVRDHPGPRMDDKRGFVGRERLEVYRERARFLESMLRKELNDKNVTVDVEHAVARMPPLRADNAAGLVADLEQESKRSYVVRVMSRTVRTRVFERWMALEKPRLTPFGTVSFTTMEGTPKFALRRLAHFERDEVFAPEAPWPAVTMLGLQAGHALHARTRTSPTYDTDDDLASGAPRTVTEGICVTVRPYVWGNRLWAWIEVEVAGLQSEVEELTLTRAVPSYRTKVAGTSAKDLVDLGEARRPKTAIICRIPHPTASKPGMLMEIVIAVSIRPAQ